MAYYQGKQAYMGLAYQATAGTAETVADVFIGSESLTSIKTQAPNYYSKEFRGAPFSEISHVYRKPNLSSAGSIEFPAYADALGYVLHGIFGSVATAGDAEGYTNTYAVAETLPIWTVFKGVDDLAVEKFHDMTMKSMSLTFEQGENIMVSVDMEGASGDNATAALTPAYQTRRALNAADVSVSLGGAPNCDIDKLEVTIDRGVQTNKTFCTSGLGAWEPNFMYPTTINVEGSFDLYFSDYNQYELFLGKDNNTVLTTDAYSVDDADNALIITATGPEIKSGGAATKDTLTLTLPKILYDDYDLQVEYDDRVKASIAFKAMHDTTGNPDAGTVSCVLINGVDQDSVA